MEKTDKISFALTYGILVLFVLIAMLASCSKKELGRIRIEIPYEGTQLQIDGKTLAETDTLLLARKTKHKYTVTASGYAKVRFIDEDNGYKVKEVFLLEGGTKDGSVKFMSKMQ